MNKILQLFDFSDYFAIRWILKSDVFSFYGFLKFLLHSKIGG